MKQDLICPTFLHQCIIPNVIFTCLQPNTNKECTSSRCRIKISSRSYRATCSSPRNQTQQGYSVKMKRGIPRVILGKDFLFPSPFHVSPKKHVTFVNFSPNPHPSTSCKAETQPCQIFPHKLPLLFLFP